MISPWLFFIGWILKSWYVGNNQIDLLRFFYRLNNYRLSLSFCARSEKEAQEIARKFDKKISIFPIHEYWIDIGQFENFHKATADYDKVFLRGK